jgi:VCBS repeat-containing protein
MKRRAVLLFIVMSATLMLVANSAYAEDFTVINTDNSGNGSLRQAIVDANDEVTHPGADKIAFGISGTGPHTIALLSELPVISAPLTIDGYTQAGASENTPTQGTNAVLEIELDFANVPVQNNTGLTISAGNSTVRGLVINGASSSPAIALITQGSNVIEGNFIGTNPAGTAARPGNGSEGEGISLGVGSGDNVIGGTTPGARNLISGNITNGVRVGFGNSGEVSQNNRVEGNLIGTDAVGTSAIPNGASGVNVRGPASNNTIGGTTAAARNIISGNTTYGVFLESSPGTVVQGNFIGTDVTGAVAVPNVEAGVQTTGSSANNVIGGTAAGAGNVISGNGGNPANSDGIFLGGIGAAVQGNVIGRNANGTAPLGNLKTGITVANGGNKIGGTETGAGNTIASNGFFGVSIRANNQSIPVLSNSIFSNVQLGIDLRGNDSSPYGVTLNDPGDGDGSVANQGQNFPVITSVSGSGSNATVSGTLNSTASTAFRLEFFASAACDPSGYGEGQTFIGSTSVTTDSSGNASFTSLSFAVPAGQSFTTSTATDPNNNTSEFSQCQSATTTNSPPTATDDSYSLNQGTILNEPARGVLTNDTDPENATLTATKVTEPFHGTLTLNVDGSFTYDPNADFSGTDSFTYKANDGQADSNAATATITVNPDTTAPTVNATTPIKTTGVSRTNPGISATFSEPANKATVVTSPSATNPLAGTSTTVTLKNMASGKKVSAQVRCDADPCKKVTITPLKSLGSLTKYKVTVSTSVTDQAGNALDQDANKAGNQAKTWVFTTKK